MDGGAWLREVVDQYHYRKTQCERAIDQVTDEQLFETAGRRRLAQAGDGFARRPGEATSSARAN
jgi:hypothetical protein